MQEQLLEKYEYLMNRLEALPNAISEAQQQEYEYIDRAGGWSALGKNDTERKAVVALATNNEVARLTDEFSGVRYASNLHASLLQYLAANGPVTAWPTSTTQYANGFNGTASLADAEAIGL